MRLRFLVFLCWFVSLAACAPARAPEGLDPAHGRSAVLSMVYGIQAAAVQCTSYAQFFARGGQSFDPNPEARAVELSETCVRRLIPPRDALYFMLEDVDPWTDGAAAKVGCAGKSTRVALQALRATFTMQNIPIPELMDDAIELGGWAEQFADARCDPLHPTDEVRVTIDPSVAPVEPSYPGSDVW